jgi:hypothetical protein
MTTYKQQALDAILKIIERYEEGNPNTVFCNSRYCPLCAVYRQKQDGECWGCPFEYRQGDSSYPGCIKQVTYLAVLEQLNDEGRLEKGYDKGMLQMRINFLKTTYDFLLTQPEEIFVPKPLKQ